MTLFRTALALPLLLAGASAHAETWTVLARSEGVAMKCRNATSASALTTLLDQVGWSANGRRRPEIDFTKEVAAVVAPGKFQANSDLRLVSAKVEEAERIVRWRFVVRTNEQEQREGVTDFSSYGEPGNEILVVTFPIATAGLKLGCIGPY